MTTTLSSSTSSHSFHKIISIASSGYGSTPAKYRCFCSFGIFYQLPSIAGTNAKSSHTRRFEFHQCHRSGDWRLLRKLKALRKQVPKRSMRNSILCGHKAWNQQGVPTASDIRKLLRRLRAQGKETTIVTCTRKRADEINRLVAEVMLGKRRTLVHLSGDYDGNHGNFDNSTTVASSAQTDAQCLR